MATTGPSYLGPTTDQVYRLLWAVESSHVPAAKANAELVSAKT